jgi:hypothetical protein
MSLINCGEFKKEVSDKAVSCPNCGAPIAADSKATDAPLITTQETSKKYKLQIAFAGFLFWAGVVWFGVSILAATAQPGDGLEAAYLILFGFLWYLFARFKIWWHHR